MAITSFLGGDFLGGDFLAGVAADVGSGRIGNSGDIAAASSYSGSVSWTGGADRALGIDVALLGPTVTVDTMTYGGAACTKIGSRATVTSFGSIEQWRIIASDSGAPAAGSNTLVVNLTGSLEFAVAWIPYTGVNQTSPTEAFNSNQATNGLGADPATVDITTVTDRSWVQAACVADDTVVAAGQTVRNNVGGTLGSGIDEDNNAITTPAGATTMTVTGIAALKTWAIAGYAWRPVYAVAAGGGRVSLFRQSLLNGLGSGGPFLNNPLG